MNALPDPEDIDAATRLINQYAVSDWVRLSYSSHAREKLRKRYVPQGVVEIALKSGSVVAFRVVTMQGHVTYRYKVRWVDRFGAVNVVTVIPGFHRLHIITVFPDESDDDTW